MVQIEKTDILLFFLEIFKLQHRAVNAPAKFVRLPGPCEGPEEIYELYIRCEGKWRTRRITIGRLAAESGSKSRCFKVIYDDVLVVKLPPSPVRHLAQYLAHIDREREIADRLAPDIECIIPGVSAILKRIPPFSEDYDLNSPQFEQRCVQKLRIFPQFQNYLKIRGQFAFFMNLSRYAFLSQVVSHIYDIGPRVQAELMAQEDALADPIAFEEKFGLRHMAVFFGITDVYSQYEQALTGLEKQHPLSATIPPYRKRRWFLTVLADRKICDSTLPTGFTAALNELIRNVVSENSEAAERFIKVFRTHVYRQAFHQGRAQISGIIANVLEMLALLRRKGVAMRDLKPDNVFIAGDPSSFPALLTYPKEYAIGLIDFETALWFRPPPGEAIRQPMRGGTPPYATPSHMFKNDLLAEIFDDLPRIFHFQDWQAVIGIIYRVVTGVQLFRETSQVMMPEMMKAVRRKCHGAPNTTLFKIYSRIFWHRATREFREKISRNREMFVIIRTELPLSVKKFIREELNLLQKDAEQELQTRICSQYMFRNRQSRMRLMTSSADALTRYRDNWETGQCVPAASPEIRSQVISLLKTVTLLKKKCEQISAWQTSLDTPKERISACDIMEMMFNVVFNAMYRQDWGALSEAIDCTLPGGEASETSGITCEDTDAIERSLTRIP
ncbi:hypothetical protein DENIS_2034 [Desulfonema ishimotonii]|uniref:Protein kinase domain-containing protein n=1 Tax=Desulfonema ishimotonii TaxID=45657 RepID=A0A401FVV9_9BACT|nr:hypothetical protein [Desulfonema ishimotonii]GBC61074.1 hypothetical protein DENIS_2034 [Desulfonema ishimotonii]